MSLTCHFINSPTTPSAISPICQLLHLSFHQLTKYSNCNFINLPATPSSISPTRSINNFPYHQIVISSTQRYANIIKIEFLSSSKGECLDYVLYLVVNHVKYFSKMSFTKWHVDKMTERQQFFRRFILSTPMEHEIKNLHLIKL